MENPRRERKEVEEVHQTVPSSLQSLVGRIIEKGFSSSSSATSTFPPTSIPTPTVIPFPVARHRSHGPHWKPPKAMDVDNGEDGDEEDRHDTDNNSIAMIAKPVERKDRKGLDLSRWREVLNEDNSIGGKEELKGMTVKANESEVVVEGVEKGVIERRIDEAEFKRLDNKKLTDLSNDSEVVDGKIGLRSTMKVPMDVNSKEDLLESYVRVRNTNKNANVESLPISMIEENPLPQHDMDDIDVENCARLNEMSQDEIAEEQNEIMKKMDPALLEMLKKRGRDQSEGKKSYGKADRDKKSKALKSEALLFRGGKSSSSKGLVPVIGESQPSSRNGGLWNAWSERVEKVRVLRFSLYGNIVEKDCFEGQTNEQSQYNVGNVTERDFLRTEVDPIAAGYTIKEAIALSRSVISGQRAFSLKLLASVLTKALGNLQNMNIRLNMRNIIDTRNLVDWQAVWAYALGPEPELILSLRISLDDNHDSVVLACAKVVQCILSFHYNENFFNISEKSFVHQKNSFTSPVLRTRPEVLHGFLHGGFWKYNTKPSNIIPSNKNNEDDENEGKNTIQDDVVVAGQDVAAGLIRMGILPRICYLLEMDPLPSLEVSLIAILIGLARHSPTSASAIVKCPRLVRTVFNRFTLGNHSFQIKSVLLLKVLYEADKENCLDFVNSKFFRQIMWHMYKPPVSLDDWINSGREHCIFTSALMIQQLRLWKVCIQYGYCIPYFADFFPALCFWLSPSSLEKLNNSDVIGEFSSVALEAYLVLEALSRTLPNLHSLEQLNMKAKVYPNDTWSWNHAVAMVNLGMKWLILKNNPFIFQLNDPLKHCAQDFKECHMLGVISAVLHMFSSIFNRIASNDSIYLANDNNPLPWLPDFVPKVGLEIVKNGFFNFLDSSGIGNALGTSKCSLAFYLSHLKHHSNIEISLASVSCLHGLVCLVISIDRCIQSAKGSWCNEHIEGCNSSLEDKILEEGIVKWAQNDFAGALAVFEIRVPSMWHDFQSIEIFGRGGPAPGVGIGWGSSGGGFWSTKFLLAQGIAQLVLSLHKMFPIVMDNDLATGYSATESTCALPFEYIFRILQKINSLLGICLLVGPVDKYTLEKAFDTLFQVPIFKYLDICIHHFLQLKEGYGSFDCLFMEEEYHLFSKVLNDHFQNRWLSPKKKSSQAGKNLEKKDALGTIHEESETLEMSNEHQGNTSLHIEWARQRLPLPIHWFLSPITTIGDLETAQSLLGSSVVENKNINCSNDILDVARGGIFLLLGLEAMCHFLRIKAMDSPVFGVPLVWKLHALSMVLLVKIEILEDVKFRNVFEILQALYGEKLVHIINHQSGTKFLQSHGQESLDFQMLVHESYNTFVETLVDHFASISYGDVIWGRQIAIYLHQTVCLSVRLAAWNALSNAHILELLPSLESCIGEAKGYMEPIEDNDEMLETLAKSWVSGGLDKAVTRGSMAFTLALHHLSSFIFQCSAPEDKLIIRNKLAKSLLRGFSRKPNQEGMMLKLIDYKGVLSQVPGVEVNESERKFLILSEACEGNSSLMTLIKKLKLSNSKS